MQFQFWQIVVLAVVQGITEFLPVSSSGHLVIIGALMAPGGNAKELDIADVSIVLHIGTLLSIIVFYWKRLLRLLTEDRRTIALVFVASLPAAFIGIPIKLLFKDDSLVNVIMSSPLAAGLLLPMTGVILLWAARGQAAKISGAASSDNSKSDTSKTNSVAGDPAANPSGAATNVTVDDNPYASPKSEGNSRLGASSQGTGEYQSMSFGKALIIGLSQAVAILPGISRSGTTISTGIRVGLNSQAAATFSFMMAIVAIGGAGLVESIKLMKHPISSPASHLIAGALISFVVGLGALWVLVRLLERGRFQIFAYWCILAGIGIVIWRVRAGDLGL